VLKYRVALEFLTRPLYIDSLLLLQAPALICCLFVDSKPAAKFNWAIWEEPNHGQKSLSGIKITLMPQW
jgi:hypothetical protein